ncbi:hypothetical protein ABZW32_03355 [Streptomyces sp. NPDC004667]|uniref:hypothetical protein n=1 Tax=Streptomyces sp. NPDC004667 TaxID=3154285 RepID=UPI0033B36A7D
MDWTMSERVVVEGLKFVAAAAAGARGIAPSRVVDEGWHALILHTAIYNGLCERLGGSSTTTPSPRTPAARSGRVAAGRGSFSSAEPLP